MPLFDIPGVDALNQDLQSFYLYLDEYGATGNVFSQFEAIYTYLTSHGSEMLNDFLGYNDEVLKYLEKVGKDLHNTTLDPEALHKVYLLLEYLKFKLRAFSGGDALDCTEKIIARIVSLEGLGVNMSESFYADDVEAAINALSSIGQSTDVIKLLNAYKCLYIYLKDPNLDFYDDQLANFTDFLDDKLGIDAVEELNYPVFAAHKKLFLTMIRFLQTSITNPIAKALTIHDFGNFVNGTFNSAAADLMLLSRGQGGFVEFKQLTLNQLIEFNKQLILGIGRMMDLLYIFEKDETNRELPADAYNRAIISTLGNVTKVEKPVIQGRERFELEYYEVLLQDKKVNLEFVYHDIDRVSEIYNFNLVRKFAWVLRTILQNMCKFEANNIRVIFSVEEDLLVVKILDDIQSDEASIVKINGKINEPLAREEDGSVKGTGGLKLSSGLVREFGGRVVCSQVEDEIYKKAFIITIPAAA